MNADACALLWDARDAARRVGRFTQGKTFDDYAGDELLRAGVERQLEIIGEALAQLRKANANTAATISALPKAIGLCNILIHAYASLDHRIVWGCHADRAGDIDLTARYAAQRWGVTGAR